jgi:hypothetical protein
LTWHVSNNTLGSKNFMTDYLCFMLRNVAKWDFEKQHPLMR